MAKLIPFALLAACDAGALPPKPEPTKKLVEVPAPSDAAVVVPADAASPTPPLAGVSLQMNHFDLPPQAECNRTRLVLRLIDKTKKVYDEYKENSTCTGACTDKEKREGAAEVAELEKQIEKGETPSVLDYNFTSCLETGLAETQIIRKVGGRDVAIITDRYIGPHDTVPAGFKVAFEVCGKLFVSDRFADVEFMSWRLDQLRVTSEDGSIFVQGIGDDGTAAEHTGTLLRVQLPACPAAPVVQTFDIWPH